MQTRPTIKCNQGNISLVMDQTLKSKTVKGLLWSSVERVGQQGVQFIVGIILARLLLVEDFGLIAMLTIFIAIAQSFIDSGFGSALIQKKNATFIDECSIFYFNIFVSLLGVLVLWISAPLIADFYDQPHLTILTRVLSLNLIINAFGLVQTNLLIKQIDFKTQLKASIIAAVVSGTIGIVMALKGFGVWSLVAQSLSNNIFRTMLLWVFSLWRPAPIFSFTSLIEMFAFGSRLLASGLLETIFSNIYLVVIGKLFSPVTLGFYSRAQGLQQLPVSNISGIVSRVTFPVFSSLQDDKPRLKRGVRKALTMLVMINFPMMVGIMIVAKPLVILLLTEKWLPCVPYLQLLCVVGMLYPLHVVNLNVLTAQGRSDLFFRLEILKKILVVIIIAVTYRWGIIAMIYGQILTSILAYFFNAYYTGKMVKYTISEQTKDLMPSLVLSVVMGLVVYSLKYTPITNQLTLLSVQVITGIMVYICFCFVFQVASFMEIIQNGCLGQWIKRHQQC